MLYTHKVRNVQAKVRLYEQMAEQRQDSTRPLQRAHYGLANQIKSLRLYDVVLQLILERFPTGEIRVVDIGCGGGLLLLAAQVAEDGYNCGVAPRVSVRGVSIDDRERQETERNVGCLVATPEQASHEWAGWANVVTAMNTLEHVNDPLALLGHIKRMLQPDGILVVDVPNNFILSHRCALVGRWPPLDIGEHINHFTPKTLDRLMKTGGFTPQRRLPGRWRGSEALGSKSSVRAMMRWAIARALMAATAGRAQVFPHMTMAYKNGSA